MPDLFPSAPTGHGTYLVMLNTYNYVVLGWNTTSTSFFTLLKSQDHSVRFRLAFGPVDKHMADIAQEHVVDIGILHRKGKGYYI